MQINEIKKGSPDTKHNYWAFSQYTKICGVLCHVWYHKI